MQKSLLLILVFCILLNTSYAAFTTNERQDERNIFSIVATRTLATFFVTLNRKEYEQLTGRHLSLLERLTFRWTQKRAHKNFEGAKQSKGFNIIGFFVPLLLGIIGWPLSALIGFGLFSLLLSIVGVAGTYVFSKDKNMHKWAWIGFGAYVTTLIALIIIILASGNFG